MKTKLFTFFTAFLFATSSIMADPIVLPAVLDVSNVSFRSEGMPDFVLEEGDYAGIYFDMGAHDSSNDTLLYAEWNVTIEPIMYSVAVDVYNTNSWRVQLYLLNQTGDTVKSLRYRGRTNQRCGQFSIDTLDLSDLEPGSYKVRIRAALAWSAMKLKDVIFDKVATITYTYDAIMGHVTGPFKVGTLSTITFTAEPNYGYHFIQWSDGVTDNPRTAEITKDTTFTAEFEKNIYTITKNANSEQGTIDAPSQAEYLDEIQLSAVPNYGYHFVKWNDGNTSNPRTITITEDKTYTAIFAKNTYLISKITNSEYGSISGKSQAEYLDTVALEAVSYYGYHFTQWSDGVTDNPRTAEITKDTTFTAEFAKNEYTISTESNNPEWGTTAGDTTVLYQGQVEISATANYGYHFVRWNDWSTNNPRTIIVTADATYEAIFAKDVYSITKITDAKQGYISGLSAAEYLDIDTIEAIPNEGYHFVQWLDGVMDNPRIFVLTQDTTFTALFDVNTSGQCGDNLVWSLTDSVLTIIGTGAMWDGQPWQALREQITQINLPQGLTTIGSRAFENCIALTAITLPKTVNSVGSSAFSGCNNLVLFEGPAVALSYIPQNKLQSITINGGLITDYYFNRALTKLDLAAAENTTLPANMLNGFVDLKELALPSQIEAIDYMTVAGCLELQAVVIPASVTAIERRAFEDCRSLSSLTFEDGSLLTTIGAWAFYNCHELANIDLPEGVTEIGKAAFYGCTYAQAAHLPASVQSIGDNAFALCSKLTKMDVDAVVPPTVEDKTFYEVSTEAPVYVPDESVYTYKSHAVWGKLNIQGRSDSPTAIENPMTNDQRQTTKVLRDGQIFILRGNKIYTVTGQEAK